MQCVGAGSVIIPPHDSIVLSSMRSAGSDRKSRPLMRIGRAGVSTELDNGMAWSFSIPIRISLPAAPPNSPSSRRPAASGRRAAPYLRGVYGYRASGAVPTEARRNNLLRLRHVEGSLQPLRDTHVEANLGTSRMGVRGVLPPVAVHAWLQIVGKEAKLMMGGSQVSNR